MATAAIGLSALKGGIIGGAIAGRPVFIIDFSRSHGTLYGVMQGVSCSIIRHRLENHPLSSTARFIAKTVFFVLSHITVLKVLKKKWNFTVPEKCSIGFPLIFWGIHHMVEF